MISCPVSVPLIVGVQCHKLSGIYDIDRQVEFSVVSCQVSVPLIDSVSSVSLFVYYL